MDSSEVLDEGSDECSSKESGWTKYIVSPEHEADNYDDDDEDGGIYHEQKCSKKDDDEVESDDSMASDATSGPITDHQNRHLIDINRGLGHAVMNKNVRKLHEGKKMQIKKHGEKMKQHGKRMDASADQDRKYSSGHKADSVGGWRKR